MTNQIELPENRRRRSVWLEYFLVAMLINFSGNTTFSAFGRTDAFLLVAAAIVLFVFFWRRKPILTKPFLVFAGFFAVLFCIQCIMFDFYPYYTLLGWYIRLLIGYGVVVNVIDFPRKFVDVMVASAILGLGFYAVEQAGLFVGFDIKNLFGWLEAIVAVPGDYHIGIYNFDVAYERDRNSGYFSEPGAFAGYLMVAAIFLGLTRDLYDQRIYRRQLIILVVAIVSTFSTTSILLTPLILLLQFKRANNWRELTSRTYTQATLGLAILVTGIIALNMDNALSHKISHQLNEAVTASGNYHLTRFGSWLVDWQYLERQPFVGWGIATETRFMFHPAMESMKDNNGVSGSLVKYGLFGFGFYLFWMGRALYRMSGGNGLKVGLAIPIILGIMFTQNLLNFPLFWGIALMPFATRLQMGTFTQREYEELSQWGRRVMPAAT